VVEVAVETLLLVALVELVVVERVERVAVHL
jgi:hypothetical protein